MMIGIEVDVTVFMPDGCGDLDFDEFTEKFIEWVKSNGWKTRGGFFCAIDEKGNAVLDRPPSKAFSVPVLGTLDSKTRLPGVNDGQG